MKTLAATILTGFVLAANAGDSAQSVEDDRLYTGCAKLGLIVAALPGPADEVGLSHRAVQDAVESRLRSARIYAYDPTPTNFLFVNLNILDGNTAFSVSASLRRWLPDTGFGRGGFVTLWESEALGTHGDAQYVLGWLAQIMDRFLVAYLRANEAACSTMEALDG